MSTAVDPEPSIRCDLNHWRDAGADPPCAAQAVLPSAVNTNTRPRVTFAHAYRDNPHGSPANPSARHRLHAVAANRRTTKSP
jgi:hypothetical protein